MRMAPNLALDSAPDHKLHLDEFERACELEEGVVLGPDYPKWYMR